ncbi:gata zinc finger [Colletotrichum incanum]|uniref:Gata zinc finger n=1 Tax=Colletotrichum incanum TaxID=1573173 RepID=A0A166M491_COLIC|nr:gata zinc finger [Colletotrichum incanum]
MEPSGCDAVKPNPKGSKIVFTESSDTVSVSPHMPNSDNHGNISTPLSLNELKAGELLQRVHGDTSQLLDNIQSLLESNFLSGGSKWNKLSGVVVNQPSLLLAQDLSQHIAASVDELVMLCHESAADAEQQLEQCLPGQQRWKMGRNHRTGSIASQCYPQMTQKQRRTSRLVCHICQTSSTPQWRNGPAGLWTLCNVCGLIYARQVRKNGRAKRNKKFPVAPNEYGCKQWQMIPEGFVKEPAIDLSSM